MGTTPEQMTRRAMLFEQRVVPLWSQAVDGAVLELLDHADMGSAPTLLVAECRTGYLVSELMAHLSDRARLMVVDPSSEMLDFARKKLAKCDRKIFYSTQSMTRLSYAAGVFHAVLCTNGLLTRGDLQLAGGELIRVLRPEGYLAAAIPLRGTFQVFEDMAREAMLRLEMRDLERSLEAYLNALLDPTELVAGFAKLGLEVVGHRIVELEIEFENAEDFLFSPFVEGTFLPRWLAVCNEESQREAVFFDVVRSINTYFRGMRFPARARIGCVVAQRSAA